MPQTPAGTSFHVAALSATTVSATAVTQAEDAVFTANNTLDADTLVRLKCSDQYLDGRVFPVLVASTTEVTLRGCDTRNITLTGVMTLTKVDAPIHVPGVFQPNVSGGDAKTVTFAPTERLHEQTVFNGWGAVKDGCMIELGDAKGPGYEKLLSLSRTGAEGVWIKKLRNGEYIATPATFAVNENPVVADGQVMAVKVEIYASAPVTRYTLG